LAGFVFVLGADFFTFFSLASLIDLSFFALSLLPFDFAADFACFDFFAMFLINY
jgi:hypothetical protein